jgi:hypothetical protein
MHWSRQGTGHCRRPCCIFWYLAGYSAFLLRFYENFRSYPESGKPANGKIHLGLPHEFAIMDNALKETGQYEPNRRFGGNARSAVCVAIVSFLSENISPISLLSCCCLRAIPLQNRGISV